jgi:hypothetical protein
MKTPLWICAILTLALGCKAVDPGPEKNGVASGGKRIEAKAFYPLSVGTRWSYDVSYLGEKRIINVEIAKQNADGFSLDSSGAELMADSFGVRDQKRYLLRNPIEIGTTWTNVVSVSSIERYKILAAEQPCDCAFGHFENCVVVESRNRVGEAQELVNEMTFAPKVGIVRLRTVLESKGKSIPQSSLNLTKFQSP